MNDRSAMFDLASLNPRWSGSLIKELEAPLARGIVRLREQSMGKEYLGFALISEFDYDGVLEEIDYFETYAEKAEADAALLRRLDAHEERILARDPGWKRVYDNVLPPEMLPATLNVMLGNFGHQFVGRGFKHTIPYDTVYVRMIRIDHAEGDLVDHLLALNGMQGEIVHCLIELGKTA